MLFLHKNDASPMLMGNLYLHQGGCVFDMCDETDEIYDVSCGTLTPDLPNSLRNFLRRDCLFVRFRRHCACAVCLLQRALFTRWSAKLS